MAKYGKWLAGGLGWALGGPIGGLLGFTLGSMFDNASSDVTTWDETGADQKRYSTQRERQQHTQPADFEVSLLILSAAVMKADGKVMRSELDYVKEFLSRQFGKQKVNDQLKLLRGFLDQKIDLGPICGQIRSFMDHSSRLQLMHYLFGIAEADQDMSTPELKMLSAIAGALGISHKDFASIRAMFIPATDSSVYKILEITEKASNDEVKKAYRRMAVKYHPDKVSHLGPEHQNAAKEKFQSVSTAYESIKKQRGMK
jgi:DnaJ like chaperone protein